MKDVKMFVAEGENLNVAVTRIACEQGFFERYDNGIEGAMSDRIPFVGKNSEGQYVLIDGYGKPFKLKLEGNDFDYGALYEETSDNSAVKNE